MNNIFKLLLVVSTLFPFATKAQNLASTDSKCLDFACNIEKAKKALDNKLFKEAIDYCRVAKSLPDANKTEADAVIYKILENIVAQKNSIESEKQMAFMAQKKAIEQENKAKLAISKADTEAKAAHQEKTAADLTIKKADNDEKRSLEAIKKAEEAIEIAKREKEKAKLDIANATNDREKAKSIAYNAENDEKKAMEAKKIAELEAQTAIREKDKATDIIANAEKTSLTVSNLVKEVSDVLTGVATNETPVYIGSKSPEKPVAKEENTNKGVVYISGKSDENASNTEVNKPLAKKMAIIKLQKAVDLEKNKQKSYELQGVLIDSLELWFKKDTSYRSELAEAYANKAWSALFLKKYKESEQACLMGLSVDVSKKYINAILGHALLLQDSYDTALTVYQDFAKDARQFKKKSNREAIFEDFEVLRQGGIKDKNMEKVKATLLANRR